MTKTQNDTITVECERFWILSNSSVSVPKQFYVGFIGPFFTTASSSVKLGETRWNLCTIPHLFRPIVTFVLARRSDWIIYRRLIDDKFSIEIKSSKNLENPHIKSQHKLSLLENNMYDYWKVTYLHIKSQHKLNLLENNIYEIY